MKIEKSKKQETPEKRTKTRKKRNIKTNKNKETGEKIRK